MAESFLDKFKSQGGLGSVTISTDKETKKTLESIDSTLQKLYKLDVEQDKKEARDKKRAAQAAKRKRGDTALGKINKNTEKQSKKEGKNFFEKILSGLMGGLTGLLAGISGPALLGALGLGAIGGAITAYIKSPAFREFVNKNILSPIGDFFKNTAIPFLNNQIVSLGNAIDRRIEKATKGGPFQYKTNNTQTTSNLPYTRNNILGTQNLVKGMLKDETLKGDQRKGVIALGQNLSKIEERTRTIAKYEAIRDSRAKQIETLTDEIADLEIEGGQSGRIKAKQDTIKRLTKEKEDAEINIRQNEKIIKGLLTIEVNGEKNNKLMLELINQTRERQAEIEGKPYKPLTIDQFKQTGGPIRVPGSGSGDKVPMMLPAGSFVMNRNAAGFQNGGMIPTMLEPGENVYGPGQWNGMHQMMNSLIPRFQEGGVVEYITGDRSHSNYAGDHGGGNYHEHIGFDTPAQATAAAKMLADQGFYIGSRNDGKHATNSLHYSDQAFDVPFYPNHTRKGYSDDKAGEEKFSADVRKALKEGGYPVGGAGGGGGGHGDPYASKQESNMMSSIGGILSGIGGQMGELLSGMMGAVGEVFGDDFSALFGGIQSLFSGGGGGGGFGVTASSDPLTGDTQAKAKAMYEYVKGKGYSDAQAKGIVVNIQRESNFDAGAASGDDGGAGGLFQWKGGRQTSQVQSLVGSKNWKGQIDYALQEDAGPDYKSATAGMSAQQAADWWMREWERPADPAAGSAKHAAMLKGLGFQKGGVVNMRGSASSNQRFEEAQQKFADRIAEGVQPIVVPVGGGGGSQMPNVIRNSETQTAPPNLPDGPSSLQAAEYLYRLNMANAF